MTAPDGEASVPTKMEVDLPCTAIVSAVSDTALTVSAVVSSRFSIEHWHRLPRFRRSRLREHFLPPYLRGENEHLSQPEFRNVLLQRLSPADLALLTPHFSRVELRKRDLLVSVDKPIQRSWFLESGIASVVATTAEGRQAEVGIIGCEGMVDVTTALGGTVASLEIFIQAEGFGHTIPSPALRHAISASETLHAVLLAFAQTFITQIAHTALAGASLGLKQRLARWLLMCADRTDGDEIPMTHEFLSLMLSVRRPGVTEALNALEAAGAIEARRGCVIIRDRGALLALAGETYGPPEASYARLLGS